MKTGIQMQDLTTEIKRQQVNKKDFIASNSQVKFTAMTGELEALIDMEDQETHKFSLTDHAHNQLASYLGINRTYYDKMREHEPQLLALNLNQWFSRTEKPFDFNSSNRMVRTLDGKIRAFLSDSYLRIDNYDILIALWPVFSQFPELQFESMNITENHMYLKAVTPKRSVEVRKGDIIQAGITITNSETGDGSFKVVPMTYRLWCLNGATHTEYGQTLKRTHRGAKQALGIQTFRTFGKETLSLLEQALLEEMRNSVRSILSADWLQAVGAKMEKATTLDLTDADKAVEVLTNRKLVSEAEGELILRNYIKHSHNNGETLYGLFNAVTRSAQDESLSYTRATELEALGDKVLDMYGTFAKLERQLANA